MATPRESSRPTTSRAPELTPIRRAQRVPTDTPAENVLRAMNLPLASPQRVPLRGAAQTPTIGAARVSVQTPVLGGENGNTDIFKSVTPMLEFSIRKASRTPAIVTSTPKSTTEGEEAESIESPTKKIFKASRSIVSTPVSESNVKLSSRATPGRSVGRTPKAEVLVAQRVSAVTPATGKSVAGVGGEVTASVKAGRATFVRPVFFHRKF